jgi:poly(A) polymerase
LDFQIDPPILEAIRLHRHEIAKSSPARLLEEYYKILRSGYAEKTFRALLQTGLLEPISAELHQGAGETLWTSLADVDEYRKRFQAAPDAFTNAILLGSLLTPLNLAPAMGRHGESIPRLGTLPLARRDVERLRQVLALQRRLTDVGAHPRARRALTHRHIFRDALTWLDVHGHSPALVEEWNSIAAERGSEQASDDASGGAPPFRRRRRRRRRRYHPAER